MDFLKLRLHFLIALVLLLVSSEVLCQQSNPFDIIKTNTNEPAEEIQSIPTQQTQVFDSLQTEPLDSTRLDSVDTPALDTSNLSSNTSEVAIDTSSVSPPIDQSNPFNVVETSGKPIVPINNTFPEIEDKKPLAAAPIIESTPAPNNSWFPNLKPRKEGYTSSNAFSLNFIFWIIVVSLLVLAAVINLKRKSFLNLYRAITNDNYLKLLQREENNGFTFFFLLLYIIFLLNTALYVYQLLINKFEVGGYKLYLSLIAGIAGIYFIRYISIFLMQLVFPLKKEARQFNFTIIMFNIIVGLLLIPINILIAYASFGSTMLYSGLAVIGIFYLLRQVRGLFIAARTKGLSYFHFFIYLCTFEVAPIFWLLSFLNY